MKIKTPNPVYLSGNNDHAILLLHSFTGTNRDVKHLATELNKLGYSCYLPNYPGHGLQLPSFMSYGIDDWWQEVEHAYHFLRQQGYQSISAIGVSLGGLMTLKLAETYELANIVVMSAPKEKSNEGLVQHLFNYCNRMGQILGVDEEEIKQQLSAITNYEQELLKFQQFIDIIMSHLDEIYCAANILYGGKDALSYRDSAEYIYHHLNSEDKILTGLLDSNHLMTHGEGRDILEANVIQFLTRRLTK
ncbi:alpha/beta fold hydrolase [Staphylococcus simiae]|uniref:alpha/beta hydrolase n=1 Tax=Staphylococcus simiae TaxID=308354 RepID=UPI001A95833A|nr:alpha/beta fold hydrolase [Staphylococcus simiae]MBO1199328.1 alpha/beta fold hydrolase [Staphylococcus simiae]MBO1201561.1 alpha/beta fold hydrolase [Staphylococcus simiae]MBO1203692.1 alpha/beta fold hydrolase [Staphylococcus simiae]MBO1211343.1 alpha/beta fold hydrolase [Staphylococcus simiae]MBO1229942.1 alpha/beta fold hydrolase [Staphylococcus simiae]